MVQGLVKVSILNECIMAMSSTSVYDSLKKWIEQLVVDKHQLVIDNQQLLLENDFLRQKLKHESELSEATAKCSNCREQRAQLVLKNGTGTVNTDLTQVIEIGQEQKCDALMKSTCEPESLDKENLPEETKNPLALLEILAIVFTHVHRKDLKNCRLVCKVWNTEATKEFIQSRYFFLDFHNSKNVCSSALLNSNSKFREIRHLELNINSIAFDNVLPGQRMAMLSVIEVLGRHLKRLRLKAYHNETDLDSLTRICLAATTNLETLRFCKSTPSQFTAHLFPEPTELTLPRLTFLTLEMLQCESHFNIPAGDNDNREYHFLNELFGLMPNLTKFWWMPYDQSPYFSTTILSILCRSVFSKQLKMLAFHCEIPETLVDMLCQASSSLKCLTCLYLGSYHNLNVIFGSLEKNILVTPLALSFNGTPACEFVDMLANKCDMELNSIGDFKKKPVTELLKIFVPILASQAILQ